MTFPLAVLLSLCVHGALMLSGFWLLDQPRPLTRPAMLDVQLLPPPATESAPTISTEPPDPTPPKPSAPQPSAPQPPPPAPTRARGQQLQRAQSALSKHLAYPPEAIARELEGEVLLLLTLDAEGRIVGAKVARSSGHAILDRAALAAARQLNALPGNPPQTLLPVTFRLD